MKAIFRGRRHFVVGRSNNGLWLERLDGSSNRIHVSAADPDLILHPSDEDLDLAEAYERREIGAFEYRDGHTYPPHQEIGRMRSRGSLQLRRRQH